MLACDGVQDVANLLADKADISISTDIDFGLHQLEEADTKPGAVAHPPLHTGRVMTCTVRRIA